ncbi:MAG: flavodoxin family protein [Ruminiclostridium sp.]
MKILIINGGFRKGNTWSLVQQVKSYLQTLSKEITFEEIHLKDANFPFCTGCSLCFRKGHTFCPHNEIVQVIMDKIAESDGLIFAAPTYNMQMPAMTKNLIDHLSFALHRPRYFNKKAMIITTTGGVGAKNATKTLAGTLAGIGFNRCYQLPVNALSYNAYKPTDKHIKKSQNVSLKFYEDLASGKLHSPTLGALIPYNIFRAMSYDYSAGAEFETQDGHFWEDEGLIDTTYFPKVPLPIYKKLFGNMFYWIGKTMSKKMIVTYKK